MTSYGFDLAQPRSTLTKDDRTHERFVKAGLAFKDVITWHQIPIKNDNDELELKSWPLMLPHNLAFALVLVL